MLDKALIRDIGNIKNKDSLLLKAILYLVGHSLSKSGKRETKSSTRKFIRREYGIQDAFKDAFKGRGNNKTPKYSSLANKLIPKPM